VKNINTSLFDFPRLRDPSSNYLDMSRAAAKSADELERALSNRRFANYWEATAGSMLILDALKAGNKTPVDFVTTVNVMRLDAPDALDAPMVALLYQGGHLTMFRRSTPRASTARSRSVTAGVCFRRGRAFAILAREKSCRFRSPTATGLSRQPSRI